MIISAFLQQSQADLVMLLQVAVLVDHERTVFELQLELRERSRDASSAGTVNLLLLLYAKEVSDQLTGYEFVGFGGKRE